jgi:hypothetical protein
MFTGLVGHILVPLRGRNGNVRAYAVVDHKDARLATSRWSLHGGGYAVRVSYKQTILLHREVAGLGYGDPLEVDHINGNRLDNRRSNLRIVTSAQQKQNQSGHANTSSAYRGVTWNSDRDRWDAQVCLGGRHHHVGSFADELVAARAASAFREAHMPHTVEARLRP